MRRIMVQLLTLAMVLSLAVAAQAAPTIYLDYGSYLLANPNPVVENFEDNILVPGLTITDTYSGAVIENGVYKSLINDGLGYFTTFTYASGFTAFGGWFDLSNPGGQGTNILVTVVDTNEVIGEIDNSYAGQFWGFTTGYSFNSLKFTEGTDPGGAQETYWTVDLAFNPVPLPGAVLLLGAGMVRLVAYARRRKVD